MVTIRNAVEFLSMKIITVQRLTALALGATLLTGCGPVGSVAEEREKAKPTLVEFERAVSHGTDTIRSFSDSVSEKLAAAQRVNDGGKSVKNTIGDLMVSGEAARTSTRMMQVTDTVYDAYAKAKRDIRNLGRKRVLSKPTLEWAQLEIEEQWTTFNRDCRQLQSK